MQEKYKKTPKFLLEKVLCYIEIQTGSGTDHEKCLAKSHLPYTLAINVHEDSALGT